MTDSSGASCTDGGVASLVIVLERCPVTSVLMVPTTAALTLMREVPCNSAIALKQGVMVLVKSVAHGFLTRMPNRALVLDRSISAFIIRARQSDISRRRRALGAVALEPANVANGPPSCSTSGNVSGDLISQSQLHGM